MQALSGRFLTLISFQSILSAIMAVVILVFLGGLVMVLVRRDRRRRDESASAGIMKAAGLNTQQNFALNTEDLDLDALFDQPRIRAVMNDSEREILKAYAGGETEGELAGRLLIPRSEAELMISEFFARLEVNNRAELLKKLQQMLREEE